VRFSSSGIALALLSRPRDLAREAPTSRERFRERAGFAGAPAAPLRRARPALRFFGGCQRPPLLSA
jgi:hypothetical protein